MLTLCPQPLAKMAMILSKIFYGSSYLGFEVMDQIDPLLGPPLMYIFVTLSSFLLMGSLTGKQYSLRGRVASGERHND